MNNPLVPDDKQEKAEQNSSDKPQEQSGISYAGDVMSLEAKEHSAKTQADLQHKQDSKKSTDDLNVNDASSLSGASAANMPRTPFTFTMGQKPQFQIRKSEFLSTRLEKHSELKPLVDNFLKDTPHKDEHKLTQAEQQELEKTRRTLAKFTSPEEALNTSLELAKLYQHLRCVEEAKKAVDLSLGIDPENNVGRQLFKELEHLHPIDISIKPVVSPTLKLLTKSNLRQRILNLSKGHVVVIGDLVIDEFLEGMPERISREAPVLILEHVNTGWTLGGAANAANNVASLGGNCHAIGVCGADDYANKLAYLFNQNNIRHSLVQDSSRPTTVKTRILSKSLSFQQQLIRLDRISHAVVSQEIVEKIIEKIKSAAKDHQVLVLSDYKGGVITDGIIKFCQEIASQYDLKLVVDAQNHFERFQRATLLTPNQPDVEQALGFTIDSPYMLQKAGDKLLAATVAEAILITRGAHGMALFQRDGEMFELPVFNKSEVFDVTGAGDTVIATMALALVTGSNFVEAMALGNLAAGIVVRKPGTATTNQSEMLNALETVDLND